MKGTITLIRGEEITVDGAQEYFKYEDKLPGIKVYSDKGNKQVFYPFTSILSITEIYENQN